MEIYIETFLLQNILINFCILKLVETTTKYKTSLYKISTSCIVGSFFSVMSAICLTNILAINLIKFLCAICMVKLTFRTNLKQFTTCFILLFTFTFALGGAITSLSSTTYVTNFGIISNCKLNLTNICLLIIALTYTIDIVAKGLKNRAKSNNYIYTIELELNNQKLKLNAYLDSGNLLQFNNKPVVILDLKTYLKLSKTDLIEFYLNNTNSIKTNTVTGCQNLKLFKIDKIKIYAKQTIILENQFVAINTNNSFKNTNYQALLSPLML